MKLYLIGLPGSGKSTLGKKLAGELSIPFIDLDHAIEQESGKSVAAIFSEHGEEYFRSLEAVALRQQSKSAEFVMACGGGTPCFHDNMPFMNASGRTVFLNVPVSEILKRFMLTREHSLRPLLNESDPEKLTGKLEDLLAKRLPFYTQAEITLSGLQSPAEILAELKRKSNG
ncbi:MAG TPA: shikimate kinase [Cyclobacteriaceae bacterium]|nr:shikimate kinase [Cyclobacteriaceae bacterium]HMV09064.1 shikimate kinase [Cyclobacteriaceae bacterium]HMV91306.1 shikimate kinase [Cyclobacteriaceae bacterium]HMW99531.1 shikimate kinase [Cyclobacteriaceae bacterium]HMX51686.1 shikimate kinase [Cyclobacteriaceae bacterium]